MLTFAAAHHLLDVFALLPPGTPARECNSAHDARCHNTEQKRDPFYGSEHRSSRNEYEATQKQDRHEQ